MPAMAAAAAAEPSSSPAEAMAAAALSKVAKMEVASVASRSRISIGETCPSPSVSNDLVTKLSLAVKYSVNLN